jgi:S1-C subfamily serine protease
MIEPILLTTARLTTFGGAQMLTGASGFLFERDERLYLVTSRHVLFDEASGHRPDRVEIELHADQDDVVHATVLSVLLYEEGKSVWRDAVDAGGVVDVAVIELDRAVLPPVVYAFNPSHLLPELQTVHVGAPLLLIGYPLGFHDALHHLPVARQAVVASSFGLRFQGQGYFLSDARTHRGISGAPVVMNTEQGLSGTSWTLLGVHSSSMDMLSRDKTQDDSLGLHCVWYADILMVLTRPEIHGPMPAPQSTKTSVQ